MAMVWLNFLKVSSTNIVEVEFGVGVKKRAFQFWLCCWLFLRIPGEMTSLHTLDHVCFLEPFRTGLREWECVQKHIELKMKSSMIQLDWRMKFSLIFWYVIYFLDITWEQSRKYGSIPRESSDPLWKPNVAFFSSLLQHQLPFQFSKLAWCIFLTYCLVHCCTIS